VIDGVLWRLRTGAPWRDLPERYGVPFGNSSLQLGGGLTHHHVLLERSPGDRFTLFGLGTGIHVPALVRTGRRSLVLGLASWVWPWRTRVSISRGYDFVAAGGSAGGLLVTPPAGCHDAVL
jgi:hypothetical protein